MSDADKSLRNVPDNVSDSETLDVVLFTVCGWRAGFEARRVRASRHASVGLVVKGIEEQLGFSPEAPDVAAGAFAQPRQCLQIKGGDDEAKQDTEILVDGPVDLVCLPVATIYALPPLIKARTRLHGLRALALVPQTAGWQSILLFDTACLTGVGERASDCHDERVGFRSSPP